MEDLICDVCHKKTKELYGFNYSEIKMCNKCYILHLESQCENLRSYILNSFSENDREKFLKECCKGKLFDDVLKTFKPAISNIELEQELAKYKELQDQLGLENADEFEWFVMLDLLTDNEKNMHILDLHRELAELKERAIVPRFKFDEECVVIMFGSYHFHRFIAQVKDDLCLTQPYNDTEEWYYVKPEMVFKTLEEAQAKLKEMKGNE